MLATSLPFSISEVHFRSQPFSGRLTKDESYPAGKLGVRYILGFDRRAWFATDSDAGHARVHVGRSVPCKGAGFVEVAGFVIEAHPFEQDLDGSFAGKSGLLGAFVLLWRL